MNVQSTIPLGTYRLRSFVYFGLVDEGVWFEGGRNSFLLPDRKLYPLVERFVALVDSGHPIEAIIDSVPAPVANLFGRLFQSLRDHDMLARLPHEGVPGGKTQLAPAARSILDMLQDRLDGDALADAWQRWRAARLLVIGNGHSLRTAVLNFSESGSGSVACLVVGSNSAAEDGWIDQSFASLEVLDCCDDDQIAAYDLVVFAADNLSQAEVYEWAARLEPAAKRAIMAVRIGQNGIVVPQDRFGRLRIETALAQLASAPDQPDLGYTGLSMLGAVAGQIAIERFFSLGQDHADHAMVVDGRLEITRHAVVPLPGLDTGRTIPFVTVPRHELPEARPLELYEQASLALDPWFDPVFGPFSKTSQAGLLQIPLMQQQIVVRTDSDRRLVNGWGLDLGAAGLRAMDAAVTALAGLLCPAASAVAASIDGVDWRPIARARLLDQAGLIDCFEAEEVDPASLAEPEIQLLARLLHYHGNAEVSLRIASDEQQRAWTATAVCNGQALAKGISSQRDLAIVLALGQACSSAQWQASGLDAVNPATLEMTCMRSYYSAEQRQADIIYQAIDQLELPGGISCGFARFATGAGAC